MKWVRLHDCVVVREGGRKTLTCTGWSIEETEKRPEGIEVNPDFAAGHKGVAFQDFLASSADGQFKIGALRAGVGCGAMMPFSQLYFGNYPKVVSRTLNYLGETFGFAREVLLGVVRGPDAPGTQGIDVGAGILDVEPKTPDVVALACYKEMFEEIAIFEAEGGAIGLRPTGALGKEAVDFINAAIVKGLEKYDLKISEQYLDIELLANPDYLVIGDPKSEWVLDNLVIAFEIKNASVELGRIVRLILKPGMRYRFMDLELQPDRFVSVICNAEALYAIYYHGGNFVGMHPTNLTGASLRTATNEKTQRALTMLRWLRPGDLNEA